jgi:succinate dehydrogenase/fumarate reductase flavoprotein subunit
MSGTSIDRREFVKGAALVTAGAAVSSLAACTTEPENTTPDPEPEQEKKPERDFWIPETWDFETDVVVIGYGGAGASAAIIAKDEGADVIILEKVPTEGGGTTRMCMGSTWWAADVERAANHLVALSFGTVPHDVALAEAQQTVIMKQWLEGMGIVFTGISDNPSAENPAVVDSAAIRGGTMTGQGPTLWETFDREVKARGIEILFDCTAHTLIQNPKTKEILGVWATHQGKEIAVKARKATALTCGGFMHNHEMLNNFLRMYPFVSYGWNYNNGDGITMAQKVGAKLWHTNFVIGRGTAWFADLEPAVAGFIGGTPRSQNYILVDKFGKRYGNENLPSHSALLNMGDFDQRKSEYTRIPIYVIFDETARVAGGLCSAAGGCMIPAELGGHTAWSSDNSAEIEKGWIKKGNTIAELAAALNEPTASTRKMGIEPAVVTETLVASVDRYNSFCKSGTDADFGVTPQSLLPIESPPFYGMPLWPGCSDNPGGPKRNAKAQVLDTDDNPIPRLYEAGSVGPAIGLLYVRGGAFIVDAMTFGMIAGKNMAAESSWE